MSESDKDAMVELIQLCADVIVGEINLLKVWATNASSSGRRTRCTKRKNRIRSNSHQKIQNLLNQAKNIAATQVNSPPNSLHRAMVKANERSFEARKSMDVNSLSDTMFTRCLEKAESNSKDSVKDAAVILRDCTA